MRVFTAVDVEDREVLLELERIRDELDFGFNPVKPEKMHVTLQFFQDVDDEDVDELIEAMRNVEVDPFRIKVSGVGVFPSRDYIRVVWAGVDSEEIFDLKKQVSRHSVPEDNNHDFQPHITMARVDSVSRRDRKTFREKLEELEDRDIGRVEVDKVKLFESVQTGNGNRYRMLEEVEL